MRPACGQCARSNIEDCEYTEGGPTVSQVLEQNIADLEARIRQLEGGDAAVVLHDPRAVPSQNYPASNRTSPSLVPTTQRVLVLRNDRFATQYLQPFQQHPVIH